MLRDDPSVEDIARMGGLEATGLAGLRDPLAALECTCVCHLRQFTLPIVAMHDEGRSCRCQRAGDEAAALWGPHTGFHGSDEFVTGGTAGCWESSGPRRPSHAPGVTEDGERQAALAHALRYGMRIAIACDYAPTIIFGAYRGYEFWFHAPDGHGQLHLGDLDGPVIGEGAVDGPIDAVRFIRDLIDRYHRVGSARAYPTPSTLQGDDAHAASHG